MFNGTISGNLCSDPETKQVGDTPLCTLRVAVKPDKRDAETEYISVEVWGKRGQWAGDSLGKGAKVICAGNFYYDSWEVTKGDDAGKIRKELRMNASTVEAIGDWKPAQQSETPEDPDDSDIAF